MITVAAQTGTVKEIKLMHVVLETEDSEKDILIPSGTIVTQIIQKKLPHISLKPLLTSLVLDAPAAYVAGGEKVVFTGELVEKESGNPIGQRTVRILDEDIGKADSLASGVTGADGTFAIPWTARKTDAFDDTVEIYALFHGDRVYRCTKSRCSS